MGKQKTSPKLKLLVLEEGLSRKLADCRKPFVDKDDLLLGANN